MAAPASTSIISIPHGRAAKWSDALGFHVRPPKLQDKIPCLVGCVTVRFSNWNWNFHFGNGTWKSGVVGSAASKEELCVRGSFLSAAAAVVLLASGCSVRAAADAAVL